MDSNVIYEKPNPKETANPLSQLLFWWLRDLFRKGSLKDLEFTDLYRPLKADESERLSNRLEKCWQYELQKFKTLEYTVDKNGEKKLKKKKMPRLYKAIIRAFWQRYFAIGVLLFLQNGVFSLLQPILQGWIIQYFNVGGSSGQNVTQKDALVYAGCLVLCTLVIIFLMHHSVLMAQQMGMRIRIACSSLIYRKILRLSKGALTQTTGGQIVNLLSNDLARFDDLSFYFHFLWIMPIQVASAAVIMWYRVGVSTFVGIGSLLLMTFPVHVVFTGLSKGLRSLIASLTDKRVQLMNELIAGIQVIKMYAWEEPFAKIVAQIRAAEMSKIRMSAYVRGTYLSFIVFTERTVVYFTLISFVLMGHSLSADISFVLATYFDQLQLTAALFFPQAMILCGETMVALARLEQFLMLDELSEEKSEIEAQKSSVTKWKHKKKNEVKEECIKISMLTEESKEIQDKTPVSIVFDRVSANWIESKLPPTVCNVSMKIKGGELCALIGAVGSGKSSILHLLLKELSLGAGRIQLFRKEYVDDAYNQHAFYMDDPNIKISYASQDAWLFPGTLRQNILFGQPYDKDRYLAVTRACALTKDFQQLSHGDMSLVGESGAGLSGGQKARVNLARAVYRQADIYLLDDPLSAVDAKVARHLYYKCIEKYLQGKTRVLVTHQTQFVKRADNIVVIDNGSVRMQGSYSELMRSNKDFVELVERIKTSTEGNKDGENPESTVNADRRVSRKSFFGRASITSNDSSLMSYDGDANSTEDKEEEEVMGSGQLSFKVYRKFFHSGASYCTLVLLVLIFVISQVATSGNDYWLSYWTNLETLRRNIENGTQSLNAQYSYMFNNTFLSSIFTLDGHGLLTTNSAIYVYTFCIVACIATVMLRNFFFMKVCTDAAQKLHYVMFFNLLQAVMQFFNNNPSGRILNRFSKDVGAMDETLPRVTLEAIQIAFVMCGVLLMVVIVNNWMIIPLVLLGILFFYIRLFYLRTAQGVKRLEGVAKSPVFSHVNSTLHGLTTIRSSGKDVIRLLQKQFDGVQDVHTSTWYLTIASATAFGFLLDIIACCFIGCVCFSFILLNDGGTLGGNVGLAISQSLIMIGTLQYGIKQSTEMVSQMTAVERILHYTNLPKEGSWVSDNPPPSTWPPKGQVTFKNVSMRYECNDPPVLKNLNVTIEPGWKVGVVGRTGAGKTSLIAALFRLFADGMEGEIQIDEKDTSTLGLHELRSRISIIPQQPFLFSESLRYNLDPFNQYDDAMLWESLRQVEFNSIALDQKVQQSGSNLSIGQRQLICLARAVLRNNKILVLDEATANIDARTDTQIQQTIRTRFAECTVITIAHRLNTIIDSDRIIVMDHGRIVEFGCPHELLSEKPKGIFSQMVDNTGVSMASILRQQAENACAKSKRQRSLELSRQNSSDTDTAGSIIAQSNL